MIKLKKYLAFNPETFEFQGFYNEGRKDLPETIMEVDPASFITDKGQHTHFNPETGWYTAEVVRTDEELREDFKRERAEIVANSTVVYNGMEFDADEVSQNRMLRPIAVLQHKPEGTTQKWFLTNNQSVHLVIDDFLAVLELAGVAQTDVWGQT